MRTILSAMMGACAILPLAALAETAYVTDNLRLGLHQAADTSDRAFRYLESGQEMEVLSRDRNYANVRLPENVEGWVKAAYLVTEKPAKLIVAEITAERDAVIAELAATRESFAEPAAIIEGLKAEIDASGKVIEEANGRIDDLEKENRGYLNLREQYKGSLPITWVGGAIVVCLIAGFLGGLWWTDRRSRRLHGGIRIY